MYLESTFVRSRVRHTGSETFKARLDSPTVSRELLSILLHAVSVSLRLSRIHNGTSRSLIILPSLSVFISLDARLQRSPKLARHWRSKAKKLESVPTIMIPGRHETRNLSNQVSGSGIWWACLGAWFSNSEDL